MQDLYGLLFHKLLNDIDDALLKFSLVRKEENGAFMVEARTLGEPLPAFSDVFVGKLLNCEVLML